MTDHVQTFVSPNLGSSFEHHDFDEAGRETRMVTLNNDVVRYQYTDRNELARIEHYSGSNFVLQSVDYHYDANGRQTLSQASNGVRCEQIYDNRSHLNSKRYLKAGNPLLTLEYAWAQNGQQSSVKRQDASGVLTKNYSYDILDRLTNSSAILPSSTVTTAPDTDTYGFDINHNLRSVASSRGGVSSTQSLTVNSFDQLTGLNGQSLGYTANGALTQLDGNPLSYDVMDRMTGQQSVVSYQLDCQGNRVSRKTPTDVTATTYSWLGGQILTESPGADQSQAKLYFYGNGRECQLRTNGNELWYMTDIQGSTVGLTDKNGNVVGLYKYSDYGERTVVRGTAPADNTFWYTGEQLDQATGLYNLRARQYSAQLRKFVSRDPISYGGGLNMYAFGAGDPINHRDPSGLDYDEGNYANEPDGGEIASEQIHLKIDTLPNTLSVKKRGFVLVYAGTTFSDDTNIRGASVTVPQKFAIITGWHHESRGANQRKS